MTGSAGTLWEKVAVPVKSRHHRTAHALRFTLDGTVDLGRGRLGHRFWRRCRWRGGLDRLPTACGQGKECHK